MICEQYVDAIARMFTWWALPLFVFRDFCGAGSTLALGGEHGLELSGAAAYKRVIWANKVDFRTVENVYLEGPFGELSDFKRLKSGFRTSSVICFRKFT